MGFIRKPAVIAVASALALLASGARPAFADAETDKLKSELEQLRQEVRELRTAIQQQRSDSATKQDVQAVRTEVSEVKSRAGGSGLLGSNSLVHLAGYGHVGYASRKGAGGSFGEVGFNPIFHYQYKDLLLFETELEVMSNAEGEAEVGLEYANMNLFANDYLTLFGGKFLSPMGYFIQNLHPAWINKFPSKPPGFQEEGGAVPVSDIGAGIKGGFPLGSGMKANYALYVGNGPRLELNAAGNRIESIANKGGTTNPSRSKLVGGRFGILPIPGLEIGVSGGTSRIAVDPGGGAAVESSRSYRVLGGDFGYRWEGLDLRGEYLSSKVGDLASSVAPRGGTWATRYVQAAYRIPGTKWEPLVRYGKFASPNGSQSQKQGAFGLNYWIEPNIVAKLAFEANKGQAGTPNDANRVLFQFAYGF